MRSLVVALIGHRQVGPTRFTYEQRSADGLYFCQQRASPGEARRQVSPQRRRLSKGLCRNSLATINSREHVDLVEADDPTRSLTEHIVATVFRWPSAFASHDVSVLGTVI